MDPITPTPVNNPVNPMNVSQHHPAHVWIITAVVVVLAAIAAWYFTTMPNAAPQATNSEGQQEATSAAAINAEINQVPDNSALDQDASASGQAVASF